jgi:hypothetical protein
MFSIQIDCTFFPNNILFNFFYSRNVHKHTSTWAGGVAQVIECLPSKSESLSSNPRATKKKKNKHLNPRGD